MSMPVPAATLLKLLAQLTEAVRANDRERATLLQRAILQQLLVESESLRSIERQVRALMEELEARTAAAPPTKRLKLDGELSVARDEGTVYPVWFGTNRKPLGRGSGFTGERHRAITRGRAEVYVPKAHRFGETGSPFWKRLLRFDLRDDHLRLQQVSAQAPDAFYAEIQQTMQAAREAGDAPHALLYLHGFNVSFEDAAIRAAQLGVDLKVPGATAFFSWPSRGSPLCYPVDEATIEASEAAIAEFLIEFAANCGAAKMHVIAHSMGNRGLLRAFQRIAANAAAQANVRFGQIFLAAPDVDRDLFVDLGWLYPHYGERATLYSSHRDLAVHVSSEVHDAPRAGYFEPYTLLDGVDTIAVPNFDVDLLGHSYYAEAEALLYDIRNLMLTNEPPEKRQRIEKLETAPRPLWSLRR